MSELWIEAPGRVVCHDEPAPPRINEGEVLVEVSRVSLCGSDYRIYDGSYGGPRRYPIRFGHEWAGRVVDAAPGSALRPGTHVTGDCSRWCGRCEPCDTDRNICSRVEKFGITIDGFSTSRRVIEERYLYRDPFELDDLVLALAEPFAVASKAVALARAVLAKKGPALVVGGGAIGIAVALLLGHAHYAGGVNLAEASRAKAASVKRRFPELSIAPELASAPVEGSSSYAALSRWAEYPVVFECSGSSGGLAVALLRAAPGGVVVCLGLGAGAGMRTDLLVSKALTLHGSIGGTGAFPEALRFLAEHREVASRLVTHCFPAREAEAAFRSTADAEARIKVQLVF